MWDLRDRVLSYDPDQSRHLAEQLVVNTENSVRNKWRTVDGTGTEKEAFLFAHNPVYTCAVRVGSNSDVSYLSDFHAFSQLGLPREYS